MKKLKFMSAFIAATLILSASTMSVAGLTLKRPNISAKCAIVMDADTGKVLFTKNAYQVRAMASLTKVMTTLLTLEAGDLDREFTVDSEAIHVEGTSMGLKEGDRVTRRDLCYGMMLPSGNDAANAAAISVAGSLSEFNQKMNERAAIIGMEDTNFANPHGLDEEGHVSTAYDMALMTMDALRIPEFREICSSKSKQIECGNPAYKRSIENNNKMLWSYDGCLGVKTGFTDAARRCLISAAEKDGKTLIVVTLNAPDDWNDHIKMLDYGFEMSEYAEIEYNQIENAAATGEQTTEPPATTVPPPATTEPPVTTSAPIAAAIPGANAKVK